MSRRYTTSVTTGSSQSNPERDKEERPTEFERFADLAKKLVAVPKSALDAKRAKPAR